jgi:hypothetical protein
VHQWNRADGSPEAPRVLVDRRRSTARAHPGRFGPEAGVDRACDLSVPTTSVFAATSRQPKRLCAGSVVEQQGARIWIR